MSTALAIRTIVQGILVNLVLAAVKVVTGLVGHSYALIADGIESANDVFASLVALISLRWASKPPDADHPYGHGKAEQLGALFSALSLLTAGGVIVAQSTRNLFSRHESPEWFTLPVLVGVVVTKILFSRYALRKSSETASTTLKGDAWHHAADAITSGAAFLGIVVALVGGPAYYRADDVAALCGCAVIGYNGVRLLYSALHEVMDGSPSEALLREVKAIASAVPQVRRIEKLRMKKIGLGYFMDVHVQVNGSMTVDAGHQVAHAVKDAIRERMPQVTDVVTHLEPFVRE